MKQPCVYIMANKRNGIIYIGVTSDIHKRVEQHKAAAVPGFTKKYGCKTLVYVEACDTMEQAIIREKQLKGGSRKKKLELIEKDNPLWHDLSSKL